MAYRGPVEVVKGAWKITHTTLFPCAEEMFQDGPRREIVDISLQANKLYLEASLLEETDPARAILLDEAINLRSDEKRRWLALQPPDQHGAWQADLAIATYLSQKKNMVAAYDMLMSVHVGAPTDSLVYKTATQNMTQMFVQIRPWLTGGCTFSEMPSKEQFACIRTFWAWVESLPE